jgi:hypothetical protein
MQSSSDGGFVIAKLDDGDDLFARLQELAAEHGVEDGMVMWAIGMLRDVEVGYFNGKEYERRAFAEPMELLALHGTYAAKADPRLHVHVAAAGRDQRVVGGHLFRATVNVLNEVCLRRLDGTALDRVLNPRSGLKELTVSGP